ncbi:U-box domain-containing protein 35-like [Tasmannia lanceolata]|uniref:U-box domain-containing protein 35-like n=1 Tax=Tasmannia lanceolata TaxID=3420 RepID=UPI004064A46C
MWPNQRVHGEKKDGGHHGSVAVAIDKDKGSQHALKWAVDNLLTKGQTLTLIHVNRRSQAIPSPMGGHVSISDVNEDVALAYRQQLEAQNKELFLPFRCFCTRKDIQCNDALLEETNIAKAIIEYVTHHAIENLVVGASSRNAIVRSFKTQDVPSGVSRGAPDFCTVYIIAKAKISSVRSAARPAPQISSHHTPQIHNQSSIKNESSETHLSRGHQPRAEKPSQRNKSTHELERDRSTHELDRNGSTQELESIKSPFSRGARGSNTKPYGEISLPDTDISFVSSSRPSVDRMFPSFYDHLDTDRLSNGSNAGNRRFESLHGGYSSLDLHSMEDLRHSNASMESGRTAWSSQTMEDVEAEMKRLKLELKQTMDMYSTACKEALNANKKARELHHWKVEEEGRLEEARLAEETALAIAEMEKAKCRAAIEKAEAAQRIAELEAQRRKNAEMKAITEAEEKKKALDALAHSDVRYRKYTIEEIEVVTDFFAESRKIGEGGYGPVYKCYLDHTSVAIKVLRPDAAQGRTQFQQEVEILSCMRHPNMVLLLGACPEYGCLVYEYMANGSLDDRLFRRGNTPVLSWQLRFRIAAEIGTGLLFLHQTKPEPLVHRDLKPGNILLDRNYVSKISDVGLARLVPPNVANNVTQYRMTSTAGTFCYIDPEYQQTGMLGIKSDIYSLGIVLLQLITAKPPMGLTHHVARAIEKGTFEEMLDPAVHDWPVEEALIFAKLALQCAELRRKDRPSLDEVVLPELERLSALADENIHQIVMGSSTSHSPNHSHVSMDVVGDQWHSGYESSKSNSNHSSITGRRTSLT